MKPVYQTRFGSDWKAPGNCFSACVASILECDLGDLPDEIDIVKKMKRDEAFMRLNREDRRAETWKVLWYQTQHFLKKNCGLWMLEVTFKDPISMPPGYHIVSGVGPCGGLHACVGLDTKIVHDPMPGEGIAIAQKGRNYIFFLITNLSKVGRKTNVERTNARSVN